MGLCWLYPLNLFLKLGNLLRNISFFQELIFLSCHEIISSFGISNLQRVSEFLIEGPHMSYLCTVNHSESHILRWIRRGLNQNISYISLDSNILHISTQVLHSSEPKCVFLFFERPTLCFFCDSIPIDSSIFRDQ